MFELLALVALIFFFAWRNGEPLGRFGWNFKNGWRVVDLGIMLFLPLMLGIGLLFNIFKLPGGLVQVNDTPHIP